MNVHPTGKHAEALRDAIANYKEEARFSIDRLDDTLTQERDMLQAAVRVMAELAPFAHAPISGEEVIHGDAETVEYSAPRAVINDGSIVVLDPAGFRLIDAVHVLNLDARFPLVDGDYRGGQSQLDAAAHEKWMSRVDRARRHLATIPGAVLGRGGHAQTYLAAVEVGCGFGLMPEDCHELMLREYNPRCQPPWGEEELRDKVDRAYAEERHRLWLLEPGENEQENCGAPPAEGGGPTGSGAKLALELAREFLAGVAPAISGEGGSRQTQLAAAQAGCGFALTRAKCFQLLADEYNPRCVPPWSSEELRKEVEAAYDAEPRRGWLMTAATQAATAPADSPED